MNTERTSRNTMALMYGITGTGLHRLLCTFISVLLFSHQAAVSKPIEGAEAIKGYGPTTYLLIGDTKYRIPEYGDFLALGLEEKDVHYYPDVQVDAYKTGFDVKRLSDVPPAPKPPPPTTHLPACPCRHSSSHDISTAEHLQDLVSQLDFICIIENKAVTSILGPHLVSIKHSNIIYITEAEGSTMMQASNASSDINSKVVDVEPGIKCAVIANLTVDEHVKKIQENERRCPGICKPVPYIEMPAKWLLPPYTAVNRALSCSLTLSAVLAHADEGHNVHENHDNVDAVARTMALILRSVARRRMEECLERGSWPLGSFVHHNATSTKDVHSLKHIVWTNHSYLMPHHSKFERRKVFGLVIWVGTNKKLPLLHAQTEMLGFQDPSLPDSERIFGWSATEDQYDCNRNVNALVCTSKFAYHWMMPSSRMSMERQSDWACLQRRPLRSMSHTLSLYDPEFLLLVDGSTYVNLNMLSSSGGRLRRLVESHLRTKAVVVGQLNGGRKISRKGFFLGGAGYLMGRGVIDRLLDFTLPGPPSTSIEDKKDSIRDVSHLHFLGVLEHAYNVQRAGCPDDCVSLDPTIPVSLHLKENRAKLRVPLVDLCTNSFSDEGTCYHSDHALSRCLMHGVYADVWDAKCQGFQTPTDPSLLLSMCNSTDVCDLETMLTCYGWVPNIDSLQSPLAPVLIDELPERKEEWWNVLDYRL